MVFVRPLSISCNLSVFLFSLTAPYFIRITNIYTYYVLLEAYFTGYNGAYSGHFGELVSYYILVFSCFVYVFSGASKQVHFEGFCVIYRDFALCWIFFLFGYSL